MRRRCSPMIRARSVRRSTSSPPLLAGTCRGIGPFLRSSRIIIRSWLRTPLPVGFGLDVSSSRELELALAAGAEQILFSGPAKSAADLELAVLHRQRVIVNLDSFRELALLGQVAAGKDPSLALQAPIRAPFRAGVRIHTAEHGSWSKFGIPLAELPRFWRQAAGYPGVELQGIQSHLSWTHDARPYCRVIEEVARMLASQFTPAERRKSGFTISAAASGRFNSRAATQPSCRSASLFASPMKRRAKRAASPRRTIFRTACRSSCMPARSAWR